jgi:RNA 3'-terminal phosphate cyclase (ATP)
MLLVLAEFENGQCCYYSLGELGKPAERVADEAVDQLEEFITSDGALDQFLADQLIMPMCFANGISEIRTSKITQHLITNAEIAQQFLPCLIEINGEINQPGIIKVIP